MSTSTLLTNQNPDIRSFIGTIKGDHLPSKPPLVELFIDYEVLRELHIRYIGSDWVESDFIEPGCSREQQEAYLLNWIKVYHYLGYDYVRMSGGYVFPHTVKLADNTADLAKTQRAWVEQGTGPIASWDDYESFSWPDIDKIDLWQYEFVAKNLPEGMGLFVCPTSGFLEVPMDFLLGYENMSLLMYDDPALVEAVFNKNAELIYRFYQRLLGLPNLAGFFQGDDMGYKCGTLISAKHLRQYVLPWHKKTAKLAHEKGLVYLLHSCGHLDEIMDDLIDDVGIDGRHSYEDSSNSVFDFKQTYGTRTAVLGGIDVDKMCRLSEAELRAHVRKVMDACMPGGRFAIGSGNSVANYIPVDNFIAMLDEVARYGR